MKYRGGAPPGSKSRQGESEEWTRKQREDDVNKDASGSGITRQEVSKGKGARKKTGKKRNMAEIHGDPSKARKKRRIIDDDDNDDDKDHDRPLKAPVMGKGLVIKN